jgi:ATP-dependent protease HslVU (ClpYQ) peptidase subunit
MKLADLERLRRVRDIRLTGISGRLAQARVVQAQTEQALAGSRQHLENATITLARTWSTDATLGTVMNQGARADLADTIIYRERGVVLATENVDQARIKNNDAAVGTRVLEQQNIAARSALERWDRLILRFENMAIRADERLAEYSNEATVLLTKSSPD